MLPPTIPLKMAPKSSSKELAFLDRVIGIEKSVFEKFPKFPRF
jgi:hypothetical protein